MTRVFNKNLQFIALLFYEKGFFFTLIIIDSCTLAVICNTICIDNEGIPMSVALH